MPRLPFPQETPEPPEPPKPGDSDAGASPDTAVPITSGGSSGTSGGAPGSNSGGGGAIPVSALAALIKHTLADHLPAKLRIVGEISNLSDRNHLFFSLKDEGATIRCVCFASNARRVRFPIRDGLQVVATGRIDFYDAQGSVQLYVDSLEPVGEGALELALRQLMAELRGQGYFEADHKLAVPLVPRRVAVVTSRAAAALQDVINTTNRRWPGYPLLLHDVRVQGPEAAPQIAEALRRLSASAERLGIDAIILTRGGGSIEDLWAFNERIVADAIYDSCIPIVAAIGHETDTTIAELVADARCSTPTQAAMTVIPDRAVLTQQVAQFDHRLKRALHRSADHARHRLDRASRLEAIFRGRFTAACHRLEIAARHTLFTRPQRLVDAARRQLMEAECRLHAAPPRRLAQQRDRLTQLARHLDAVGPHKVLQRGYTYTTDTDGRLLRSQTEAAPGSQIITVFHDGKVQSTVDSGSDIPVKPAKIPGKQASKRGKTSKKKSPDGPGLFQ